MHRPPLERHAARALVVFAHVAAGALYCMGTQCASAAATSPELERALSESTAALDAKRDSTLSNASGRAVTSPLEISGDLRLRVQGDYSAPNTDDRESAQLRARMKAAYALNGRVNLAARLTTGSAEDPNSTDVQLSNFDDDLDVSLDLAYAQLALDQLTVYAGKIPLPFARTDLVWDADVNPQGVSALYARGLASDAQLRFSSLYFIVDDQVSGGDSTMIGAQVKYEGAPSRNWKLNVSAAYYDYELGRADGADEGDFRSNSRNPDGTYQSDFNLCDFIVEFAWSGIEDRWPMKITADYVANVGTKTAADSGYAVDFSVGRASSSGDWRIGYGYSAAERDAIFAAFAHDNIALATNYRLHTLTVDYIPAPNTSVSAVWYRYAPKTTISNAGEWSDRLRVALLFTF